jgi:hypothetical protein
VFEADLVVKPPLITEPMHMCALTFGLTDAVCGVGRMAELAADRDQRAAALLDSPRVAA